MKQQTPTYWRNLAELENVPELEEFLAKEFPDVPTEPGSLNRRRFMQLMGASFALAGAAGCWQDEKILPYSRRPEGLEPGTIRYFATGMEIAGAMHAIRVASFDNRPFKIESHLSHPYTATKRGRDGKEDPTTRPGTDSYAQASILGVFDPDRSGVVKNDNAPSTANDFATWARGVFEAAAKKGGKGLAILAGASSSPTRARMRAEIAKKMPQARWTEFESLSRDNAMVGSKMAFGAPHRTHLALDTAEVIVSLDDDLFGTHPARLRLARDWASARRPEEGRMNRMYVVESRFSSTGAAADHRLPMRGAQIRAFAMALEAAVKAKLSGGAAPKGEGALGAGKAAKWIDAVAADLVANKGKGVVTVGHQQHPEVHALAHRMNAALGNAGKTVTYTAEEDRPTHAEQLKALVKAMQGGEIETLIVLGSNPVYEAPGDLNFAEAFAKVKNRIHHGLYFDETAQKASWHIPLTHFLETWSDGRTYDGTVTVAQPLITPMFNGHSELVMLSMVLGDYNAQPLDLVRETVTGLAKAANAPMPAPGTDEPETEAAAKAAADAKAADAKNGAHANGKAGGKKNGAAPAKAAMAATAAGDAEGGDAEAPAAAATSDAELTERRSANAAFKKSFDFRKFVHDGFVPDSAFAPATPAIVGFTVTKPDASAYTADEDVADGELELVFYDDGKVYDGRFANNGWLQETPEFMTKLTWDNAAVMGPAMATKLGVKTEDMVTVTANGQSVTLPVYVQPGQPQGSVALAVGYGREAAGVVGGYKTEGFEQVGFDVQPLRAVDALFFTAKASVKKAGGKYRLATTQTHHMIDTTGMKTIQKRAPILVRSTSLDDYKANPKFAKKMDHHPPLLSLFEERKWKKNFAEHQWGMTIDLSNCIGCNACVVSCTSENNVPVVGKDQVLRGREMHWMRIDRYFAGDAEDPQLAHMPTACVHCENAPCEQVCPVAATIHDAEGTNNMVYNRCVGTRYCANNCPYKVRRFNFHNYHEDLKDESNTVKEMAFNPDVTVRFRGVMEKCSYCLQRIAYAKTEAKVQGRPLRDGDIIPACQSACPTQAIVFGDINDENSRVSKLREVQRSYAVLAELNIKPRTLFLAKIRNTNPALAEA